MCKFRSRATSESHFQEAGSIKTRKERFFYVSFVQICQYVSEKIFEEILESGTNLIARKYPAKFRSKSYAVFEFTFLRNVHGQMYGRTNGHSLYEVNFMTRFMR